MWGHMAGMGNVGDWCDSGASLPCELLDSLDDISRAPSDSASAKMVDSGDLDYLYQVSVVHTRVLFCRDHVGRTSHGMWTPFEAAL